MAIQKIDEKTYAFGKYNGHTLIWDVIDKDARYPMLLLCREIVCCMAFDEMTNIWEKSELRDWLNSDFLSSFNKDEKDIIVARNGDYFFLLSTKEYYDCEENISNPYKTWWLRSPGYLKTTAACVDFDGSVCSYDIDVSYNNRGVRPAVLIRPLGDDDPQSDTKYYITNIRRCTLPGGFEYEAEPVRETKKFYCDDEKTTKKLWEMVKGENRPVRLSFDKTTNNNNDLKRLIDIYD